MVVRIAWVPRDGADWPVGYTYLAVFAVTAIWIHLFLSQVHVACWFKSVFGFPCPSCGMTRQLNLLFAGQPLDAFFCNPGAFAALSAMLLYFCLEVVGFHLGKKPVLRIRQEHRRRIATGVLILFFLNWGYLILTGR